MEINEEISVEQMMDAFSAQLKECRVPGTKHEYYDCCFASSESTCTTLGGINAFILAVLLLVCLNLILKSTWFRYNKLLWFTCLF